MSKEAGLFGDPHAAHGFRVLFQFAQHFRHVVEMALGIDAAWKGEAYEFHGVIGFGAIIQAFAEHDASDFDAANTSLEIQGVAQAPGGVLLFGQMGKEVFGIQVHRVAAGGLNDGDSCFL